MIDWTAITAIVGAVLGIASAIQTFSATRTAAKRSEIDALRVIIEAQGEQIKALQNENERLRKEVDTLRAENAELRRGSKGW